jgi:hypothetical protein
MLQRYGGVLTLLLATSFYSNIAIACTPPEIPSCYSSRGLTSGRPDYNFCRGQITQYEDYGKVYLKCLKRDFEQAVEDVNRKSQDYEWKKSEYNSARQSLSQAANNLNQAQAEYESQREMYQNNAKAIQENLNNIIDTFNQMFGG